MKVVLPFAVAGHDPGDEVDLPEAEAKDLLRQGIAKEPKKPAKRVETKTDNHKGEDE